MKPAVMLAIIILLVAGCTKVQDAKSVPITHTVSGNQELLLNEQDLRQIGMTGDLNNQDLQQLGIIFNGTSCKTEEYPIDEYSSLTQYSICSYAINSLDTEVIIELKKFTNLHDRNGSYQYESLHLRGYQGANEEAFQGLISENDYGDMSSFYYNNESTIYYYHLYIAKEEYLIHITSKGGKEAEDYIAKIGERILSKFG